MRITNPQLRVTLKCRYDYGLNGDLLSFNCDYLARAGVLLKMPANAAIITHKKPALLSFFALALFRLNRGTQILSDFLYVLEAFAGARACGLVAALKLVVFRFESFNFVQKFLKRHGVTLLRAYW